LERRLAEASISGMNLADLKAAALQLAAGRVLSDSVSNALEETRMRSVKSAHKSKYKAKLLAEIAPKGVNVDEFASEVHIVKRPSPANPVARVMMQDGGWCEIDTTSGKTIRTWGTIGRAQDLARAFADAIGCEVTHLAKTSSIASAAEPLRVIRQSEDAIQSLTRWWVLRGYTAIAAVDGCWIDVGHSRIRDTGDLLEIYGGLTNEAVTAAVVKAKDAWDGSMALEGKWSQAEQDQIWIAAQRHGVEVRNCTPSKSVQQKWRAEQESTSEAAKTIAAVNRDAEQARNLLRAATGDTDAAARLSNSLQAFVALHLDDAQRSHLAAQRVDSVLPELRRFSELGAAELEAYEKTGRTLAIPTPTSGTRAPEHTYSPR